MRKLKKHFAEESEEVQLTIALLLWWRMKITRINDTEFHLTLMLPSFDVCLQAALTGQVSGSAQMTIVEHVRVVASTS